MADFFRLKAFECDPKKVMKKLGLEEGGRVQKFIDTECLRLSNEKAPKDTGALIKDANTRTKVGCGQLEYHAVYARRWYYMPANFQEAPERGNYWFERMKQQYKERILAGAQKIANGG
ncbi:MAG: capsid protein [Lachnospiraceae bacterium]|nr:capsid protein [Lachnospiraceae bacterium]